MWIQGRRRGGAKDLSTHLQKTDENESVKVRELSGFSFSGLTGKNLEQALRQMEAIGYGKSDKRNLYHAIISPAYGETLTAAQQKFMVEYYAAHMGFKGHQYALVEHWKKGKQHFHIVFNIIDPATGKTHELKWTKQKEWRISRGLEEIFGLSTPKPQGKAARTWQIQYGKRTGIDPRKARKTITAIYHASMTARDFLTGLDKAGYALTRGRRDQLVLVDRFGGTIGLMRMIEGKKLADLRRKFPGIEKMQLPLHADLVKARKAVKTGKTTSPRVAIDPMRVREEVQKAYRTSKTGAEFFAKLNNKEYSLGRGLRGFAVIDINGGRHDLDRSLGKEVAKGLGKKFPDLAAIRPRPVSEIIRRMKTGKSRKTAKPLKRTRLMRRPRKTLSVASPLTLQPHRSIQKRRQTQPPAQTSSPVTALFSRAAGLMTARQPEKPASFKPTAGTGGWPAAAIADWASWGHKNPPLFFAKWPELGTGPSSKPGGPGL